MDKLEKQLEEMLVKNAPFQIPENGRKWLAEYAWIFALVGVVLGIFSVLGLLTILGLTSALLTVVGVGRYALFAWISLLALIAYLVVLGMAVPKLKNMEAKGWQLMYYSTLAYCAYSIIYAFSYIGAGAIFTLFWNLVGLTISLYVLFQVKSKFKA